jgi:hypothetical protein
MLVFANPSGIVSLMTNTTAERDTQANIQEIISAIAGVQALIVADVKSPLYDTRVQEQLGTAYAFLTEALAKRAVRLTMFAI